MRTAVGTEPDHARPPQLWLHLPQLGLQLDGAAGVLLLAVGYSVWLSPLVRRSRLSRTATEMGLPQKLNHCELGATAQGRQDDIELGVPDPTLIQAQVLEGGGGSHYQNLKGPRTYIGQVDCTETQALQLIDVQALGQGHLETACFQKQVVND